MTKLMSTFEEPTLSRHTGISLAAGCLAPRPARSIAAVVLTTAAAVMAGAMGPSVPPAAASTVTRSLPQPLTVALGTHTFGNLHAPDAVVARAGPDDVGFYNSEHACCGDEPHGPRLFDVARDRKIWLHDEVNDRMLVWQPGRPSPPIRTVPLPQTIRIVNFTLGPDGTIYATCTGRESSITRLCALTPTGQLRWTAPTAIESGNTPLHMGADGVVYDADTWTPLTTPAGRPLPVAQQRRPTAPSQPLPGRRRLVTTTVSTREHRFTIVDHAGNVVAAWRVTSNTDLGVMRATPALVGEDLVVPLDVSRQTKSKFLWERLILRLAPASRTPQRLALDARTVLGGGEQDTPLRVGPDGRLYQLRSDRSGVSIARYSLAPATPPIPPPPPTIIADIAPHTTTPPATAPPVDQPTVTAPTDALPPAQPAAQAAPEPASSRIIAGLGALAAGSVAAMAVWLLYRRRHPASPSR
jgi:hypothetical protein